MNKRNIGSLQEDRAAGYLIEHGFEILERNYRCKIGEIDIIALKDNVIRFIEIKYRKTNNFGYAIEAVSKKKQMKILKIAQWFINERKLGDNIACSFDVIAIQGNDIHFISNCYGAM